MDFVDILNVLPNVRMPFVEAYARHSVIIIEASMWVWEMRGESRIWAGELKVNDDVAGGTQHGLGEPPKENVMEDKVPYGYLVGGVKVRSVADRS